jgi:outer membrane beta-barrel protein
VSRRRRAVRRLALCAVAGLLGGGRVQAAPPPGARAAAEPPAIHEPAPRPQPAARVQARFAEKADRVLVFAGAEYLDRGDFYNCPGARVGATYYLRESLGLEVQLSHYWSSLNATAQQVAQMLGALPDSRPPTWLGLLGARYSFGYGKILVGRAAVIHFEPQLFVHGGLHDYGGDVQPSGDAGLGLLVFLTPRVFTRFDLAVTLDRESRSDQNVAVLGALPALTFGGVL